MRVLRSEDDAGLVQRAVLAMARVSPDHLSKIVSSQVLETIEHADRTVRHSATLSLGLANSSASIKALIDLASDTHSGRGLVGGQVPWQIRSRAALSLGISQSRLSVSVLESILLDEHAPDDVRSCAALALGLTSGRAATKAVKVLRTLVDDDAADEVVRAQALVGLGKLGDVTALPLLVAVLTDDREDARVRQSAAIAVGLLGEVSHVGAVEALAEVSRDARDETLRGFALIALGRIAGRAADNGGDTAGALETVVHAMRRPRHTSDRPWAALAIGLVGLERGELDHALQLALTNEHESESNPTTKGAFALALGLAGVERAGEDLHDEFSDRRDEVYRGYAATGLALMGHWDVEGELLAELVSKGTPEALRLQLAGALSILGTPGATDVVMAALLEDANDDMGWALARALGRLDDSRAVESLVAIVDDTSLAPLPRSLACASLGFIGELATTRWNTPLVADFNFKAPVDTLTALVDL